MKKFLSLVLALVMVLSLGVTAGAVSFTDEAAITKTEAVGVLAGLGIINGYEAADGTYSFAPNGNITRGAAAKIICMIKLGTKVAGILSCETAPFKDVAKDSTFAPYIAYCANEGIVGGYPDGTFKPGNPVTGYAFTKMLLNALGIKGDYEGANYGVNVALAANEAKLFKGMDADTVYGANCTREDACQLAFNALNYTATGATEEFVVYTDLNDNEKYDAGTDTKHWSGADALTALVMAQSFDADLTQTSVAKDSLGYKNFDLTKGTDADDFGRKSTIYTNGLAESDDDYVLYASFAKTAKLSYTAPVEKGKIWSALGFTKATDTATLKVYTNGSTEPTATYTLSKGNTDEINTQGTLMEIYTTSDAKVFEAYAIETFVKELDEDDIIEAKPATTTADAKAAFVIIEGSNKTNPAATGNFKTAAFKKGDVVLYTKTAAGKIVNVVKAASVVGKVTATATEYFRIDGVQYKLAAKNAASIGDAGYKYSTTAYTYYLDTYGNVIYALEGEKEDVVTKYAYVTGLAYQYEADDVAGGDLFSGSTNKKAAAQVKFIDLTTAETIVKNIAIVKNTAGDYVLADKYGAATSTTVQAKAAEADSLTDTDDTYYLKKTVNTVYTYSELEDGSVVLGAPVELKTTEFTEKKAEIKYDGDKLFTNSATKITTLSLTYKDNSEAKAVTAASVATKTGIATKTEDIDNTIVIADEETNIVSAIYVVKKNVQTSTANYVFYKGEGETGKDGNGYQFYKNGEVVEYVYTEKSGDDFLELSLTEGKAYDVTLNSKGQIAAAADVSDAIDPANEKLQKVVAIDDTYLLLESFAGTSYTLYFKSTGCSVVDLDADYAADTLSVGDKIWIYGTKGTKTFTNVDLIVIDND